jgi:hypothetical protein
MTVEEFFKFTADFPDIADLLRQSDRLNKEVKQVRRRLNTKANHYSFLDAIVRHNYYDKPLEKAVQALLKEVGYTDVRWLGHNNKYEDLQIWLGDRITTIEVKGLAGAHPKEHDCSQVIKYMARRQDIHKDKRVMGLFIVNHNNSVPDFTKRSAAPFDKTRIKDAELFKYGLLTTRELFYAFIKLKTGQLTFNDFDTTLHGVGLIKFDSGGLKASNQTGIM